MRCIRPGSTTTLSAWAAAGLLACVIAPFSTVNGEDAPGTLSVSESRLQGIWKAKSGWVLVFDGTAFSAKSGTEWYKGSFSAPVAEDEPAPLDIKIEDCACNYKGMTSQAIYRWEDTGLLLSGATPGKSRPPIFDDAMGLVLEMTRVTGPEKP